MNIDLTLSVILLGAGAFPAAAVVRQLVALVKVALPGVGSRVSGAFQAFVFSAILYVVAYLAVGGGTRETAFVAFLSWLACATSAVGINSTVGHYRNVRSTYRGG